MNPRTLIKLLILAALPLLFALVCLSGCAAPGSHAARRDATAIQKQSATADASVGRSQAANGKLAQSNTMLAGQNAQLGQNAQAVQTDAQRIDAKDQVLLNSKWTP